MRVPGKMNVHIAQGVRPAETDLFKYNKQVLITFPAGRYALLLNLELWYFLYQLFNVFPVAAA